ncbi:hypothetical protein BJY00DRAFT_285888 [Aspergillus carlsbadensis]|nr:hypothetical protein BJY00DRAFT_285888 [Aspergillus carlsbadensis]
MVEAKCSARSTTWKARRRGRLSMAAVLVLLYIRQAGPGPIMAVPGADLWYGPLLLLSNR